MRGPSAVSAYRAAGDEGRGEQDRRVLLEALLPALLPGEREEDRVIDLTIRLAETYEGVAGLMETAFHGLLWGLTRRGGQAKPDELKADRQLRPVLKAVCSRLQARAVQLRELIAKVSGVPQVSDLNPIAP